MTVFDAAAAAFLTIVFPGLLFTAGAGLYLSWVDRKITARIQSRVGPPWWQPYADIVKLMGKRMILPRGSGRTGFLLAPLLGVAAAAVVAAIVWTANIWPGIHFVGDLIVVIYLLAIPSLALVLGGAASGSPFGAIGAGREMQMIVAYELPFILAITVVVLKVNTVHVAGVTSPIVLADIVRWQAVEGVLALSPSGVLALIVAFFCMQAKLGCLPFDQAEAETEIIGGPLAEYSGSGLALFKITKAMMLLLLPVFLVTVFLGGIGLGADGAGGFSFSGWGIFWFVVKVFVLFLLIVVIKSTHARLRIDQVLRIYWGKLTLVALAAIVLAVLGF